MDAKEMISKLALTVNVLIKRVDELESRIAALEERES